MSVPFKKIQEVVRNGSKEDEINCGGRDRRKELCFDRKTEKRPDTHDYDHLWALGQSETPPNGK